MRHAIRIPADIELVIKSLTGVHFLANVPDGDTPANGLLNSAYQFFQLLHCGQIDYCFAEHLYHHNFAPETMDDGAWRAIRHFSDHWRYGAAIAMATTHTAVGNLEKSLRYSNHLLVNERVLPASEQTSIADATEYDTTMHAHGAKQLCNFALADNMLRLTPASLRVLDLACGSGLNSEFLVRYASHITGLDIDLHSLRQTSRTSRYDRCVEGDARQTMATLAGPYDLVICTGALYYFADLDWLFAQLGRLLTPQGQFVTNAVQADDAADCRITRSGNYRHCHSLRYMERRAASHGLHLTDKMGSIAYGLPLWLLRVKRFH